MDETNKDDNSSFGIGYEITRKAIHKHTKELREQERKWLETIGVKYDYLFKTYFIYDYDTFIDHINMLEDHYDNCTCRKKAKRKRKSSSPSNNSD